MRIPTSVAVGLSVLLSACGGGGDPPSSHDLGEIKFSDVSLTVTGAGAADAGATSVPFDVVVTNIGKYDATNVQLEMATTLIATTTIIGCTASGGAVCPQLGSASLGNIPANGSLDLKVVASFTQGTQGDISTSFKVTADNDSQTGNNAASFVFKVTRYDLAVTGKRSTALMASGQAVYTMTVTNLGPEIAVNPGLTNLVMRDA